MRYREFEGNLGYSKRNDGKTDVLVEKNGHCMVLSPGDYLLLRDRNIKITNDDLKKGLMDSYGFLRLAVLSKAKASVGFYEL